MRIGTCIAYEAAVGAIPVVDLMVSLESLGHDCILIAPSQNGSIPDCFYIQATRSQICDETWWSDKDLRVVFVYSLLFPLEAVSAAKRAGTTIVLDCDSDGRISPALWPLDHWRHYRDERHSLITKARIAKLWLMDILFSRRFETRFLKLLGAVDLIRIESQCAANNLIKLSRYRKMVGLETRVRVVPFCAPVEVCDISLPTEKMKKVVIAGRLNIQQKNPLVLACTVEHILATVPEVEFECFCRGDCPSIRFLSTKYPSRVSYNVDATKEEVRDALRSARILLSASRWETLPVIGIEALCMGCTIVATPIDGYVELCNFGQNGTIAASFRAPAICTAFEKEWRRWESGERDPQSISNSARSIYRPEEVARRLVHLTCEGMTTENG